MNNNFFYSINVNDRVRFPVLGEWKKDPVPDDTTTTMELDTSHIEDELHNEPHQKVFGKDEDSYFEAFKQTNCEKGLYCDEILKFLEGFFQRARLGARPWRSLQAFLDSFSTYVHNHSNEVRELMDTMNTKRLITPYMELDLPVNIVEEFNQLEEGDPRIHIYQLNPVWGPAIKEFGFFWERYESTKEVLCLFIWSTIDQTVGMFLESYIAYMFECCMVLFCGICLISTNSLFYFSLSLLLSAYTWYVMTEYFFNYYTYLISSSHM